MSKTNKNKIMDTAGEEDPNFDSKILSSPDSNSRYNQN